MSSFYTPPVTLPNIRRLGTSVGKTESLCSLYGPIFFAPNLLSAAIEFINEFEIYARADKPKESPE